LGVAASLLGNATSRIIYDLEQFRTDGQPVVAATITREVHVSDLPAGTQSKVQVGFSYSDGFGREVLKKIQAEPGDAPQRESNVATPNRPGKLILENGKTKLVPTDPRWVGNGRTIFNNKGKPVKQYEPFFSGTHLYEDELELVMTGVTPILFYDPAGRVVATLHPNHSYEKVVFDPWQQVTWDVNDTVSNLPQDDAEVGQYFRRLPEADYLPTWLQRFSGSAIAVERDAAQKALAHAGTPAIAHLDTLGRPFLTIADNGTEKFETRVDLDLEGNTIVVMDARQNAVMIYGGVQKDAAGQPVQDAQGKPTIVGRAFDLLGHNLYSYSMDAGDRWMLNNVAGKPLRAWNDRETRYDVPTPPKGHVMRTVYDALQRPTHLYMQATGAAEILVERLVYGEGHPEALRRNLKGKPFQHYDGAGVVSNWEFDFKGNLLRGSRQLAKDYKPLVDWMVLAGLTEIPQVVQAAIALLEPKTFDSSTLFDGMNRPIEMTMPDRSVVMPVFNEANLLNQVKVKLQGAAVETLFVKNIDYDEKGQRSLIEYGNDATNQGVVKTEFQFDPETFRLVGLKTTRKTDGVRLQDLSYTYDPVGNITTIRDEAQQTVYFNGEVVSPSTQYQYDALYRLIKAEGREHIGQTTSQPPETNPGLKPHYDSNDWTRRNLPHPNQGEAMRNYAEAYEYDGVGNILAMIHQATDATWTRRYDYETVNNRLRTTSLPGDGDDVTTLPSRYEYDTHGNTIKMLHLPLMRWDFKDQLRATSQQVRSDGGTPEITYYVYDASGQRVRKVTERQAAAGETSKRKNERIYLGGFEVYREYSGSDDSVMLERETLHIMDDQQRIALVETKTVTNPDDESPTQLIRFQFGNHLGSASLELDDKGGVISYEEYYPYGSTAYHAVDKSVKAAGKRYRYTGMERDDETGLNYHSARYYVPWLGRWASADPIGINGGANLFSYASSNPIRFFDLDGKNPSEEELAGDIFEKYLKSQGIDYQRKVAITVAVSGGEWVNGEADFLVESGPDSWEPVEFKGRTSSPKTTGQKKYLPALEKGAAWSTARSTKKSALNGKVLSEVYGSGGGKVITLKSVADAKKQFRKIFTAEYFNRSQGFKGKLSSNLQGNVVEHKKSSLPAHLDKPGGGGKALRGLGKAAVVVSVIGSVFAVGDVLFGGADAEAAAISAMPFVGESLAAGYTNAKAMANDILEMKRTEDDAFAVLEADRKRAEKDRKAEKAADEEKRKDLQGLLGLSILEGLSQTLDISSAAWIGKDRDISAIPQDFVEAMVNFYKRQK
jgi:RHS repeat-associated protein